MLRRCSFTKSICCISILPTFGNESEFKMISITKIYNTPPLGVGVVVRSAHGTLKEGICIKKIYCAD